MTYDALLDRVATLEADVHELRAELNALKRRPRSQQRYAEPATNPDPQPEPPIPTPLPTPPPALSTSALAVPAHKVAT